MKKYSALFGLVLILVWINSCAPTATVTSYGGPSISQAQAERYDGPKARIAVGEFTDKTAKGGGGSGGWMRMWGYNFKKIGDGMQDMLTTALLSLKIITHPAKKPNWGQCWTSRTWVHQEELKKELKQKLVKYMEQNY